MPFAPLRGFRDYVPPEAGARSELMRRMRASARRCGFSELETPSVEPLDLYKVKSGEEITREVWAFQDKGGRDVALAPETTPSLARIYAERAKSEPLPVKWFTVQKLWRYEEPQAGRTREFSQLNFDILGVGGVEAEVETLASAALALDEAGAAGLYAFRINDRPLAEGLGRHFGASDVAAYFRTVDRYRKSSAKEFLAGLESAGIAPGRTAELTALFASVGAGILPVDLPAFFDRIDALGLEEGARAGVARIRALMRLCEPAGIADRVVFDPTVVRGLAYYTSTVFEAYAKDASLRALFGGGRYDRLIELFGGPATPACGLAIGDQTLELLLKEHGRWPEGEPALDTYVVTVSTEFLPDAIRLVRELRLAGVSADTDLLGRSMSRQLKEAARQRARRALILGPLEASRGAVVERDLATGDQREIPRDEAARPA